MDASSTHSPHTAHGPSDLKQAQAVKCPLLSARLRGARTVCVAPAAVRPFKFVPQLKAVTSGATACDAAIEVQGKFFVTLAFRFIALLVQWLVWPVANGLIGVRFSGDANWGPFVAAPENNLSE